MKTKKIFLLTMIATVLAACNDNNEPEPVDLARPIQLNMSVGTVTRTFDPTRTEFEEKDAIGLYVATCKENSQADMSTIEKDAPNGINNVKFTRNNAISSGSSANGWEGNIYWQSTTLYHTIYAYSPYTENLETDGDRKIHFTLQADQSAGTNYKDADYLWYQSTQTLANNSANAVGLQHKMSLIKIVLTAAGSTDLTYEELKGMQFKILGSVKSKGTFDVQTGTITADETNENIDELIPLRIENDGKGELYYYAIILPGTQYSRSSPFISLTQTDADGITTYIYTLGEEVIALSGNQYTFNLTASKQGISLGQFTIEKWNDGTTQNGDAGMTVN